ncbi:MAG: AAA family ATPase, partial [Actinomycetota bacterium]
MRLHRLTVQAFGPFADRQEVDLDALAASGLFLLHGPTGAGKTSVLDAVCFALYGRVPGARAAGQPRLRSDHAADGLAPEVVCDLSVAGRRFEVTRSPAWERPKKRGSGTTTEPGRTLLREHVDGSWVPRSSRNDEASQLLTDVLGMGLEQFTKVVLLPQGEFAAFLRADAEARRPLLQRLFGTDRFDAVERWLADERRRLGRLVEDADSRLGRLLAQADQAVAGVLPGTGRPDPDVGPVEHVAFLRREVDAAVAGCRRELRHARSASVQATAARDRARARLESIRRLVECLRERDELAAEGEQAERTQAWLRDARRAAAVRGHLVALDQAVADQQSAASARAEADAVAGLDPAGDDADALAQLRDLRTELARLADAAQDEVALAAATASAAAAGVEVTRLETALASRAEQDAARARERDDVRQQAESLAAPAAAVEAAASALHEAEERLRAARTAARVEEDVSAAAARAAEAVDVAQRAREAWLDLRERRLAGMAAELAEGLVPGESCPVCGALDHPAPAAAGGDGVSAEAEGRARRTWEDAETARQAADRRLAELREQLAQATGRSGGLTVGQAAARVSAARQTLESAQEADEHRTAALSRLAALETELADGRARREELTAELARARASAEESARRVAELDGRLAALRGEDDSLASRSARLRARVEALQAALDARAAHRREGAAAERAAEAAAAAARDAGFPDPGAAAAALRPAEEIEAGEAFLRRHHDRRAAVEARLAEPGLL